MYKTAVVIPTLNEERFIARCLESVIAQTFPLSEMDVMVIDGRSRDRTREIVSGYHKQYSNIRLLDNPGKIQSIAFNIGVANSTAPYIVRLDAHAEYNEEYIELCIKHLSENEQIGDVGGIWDILPQSANIISEANAILNRSRFGIGGASYRVGTEAGYVDTVPFGAFPRSVVNEIGGMREDMPRAEDNEYVSRIRKAGYKIYLDPKIRCSYYSRDTIVASCRQMYANGVSIGHLFYIDRSAIGFRHFVPLAFLTSLLLSVVGSIIYFPVLYVLYAILIAYFTCSILSTCVECKKYGWKYFLVLPFLFFAVHLSYGIGTVAGLFKYLNK